MIAVDGNYDKALEHVFYKNIMNQARDIILVLSTTGAIIDANQAAEGEYGYTIAELRGMHIRELRCPETFDDIDAQMAKAQREGILFRTVHRRRNGERFPVEVSSRRFSLDSEDMVVSIGRNISRSIDFENKLQESNQSILSMFEELLASDEELKQQFDELQVKEAVLYKQNFVLMSLQDTALGLMHRHDPEDLLQQIMISATELLGTPSGYIYRVNKHKEVFYISHGVGICVPEIGREIPFGQGIIGAVYQTGRPVLDNNYDERRKEFPRTIQFEAVTAVLQAPLKVAGQVVGSIGLAHTETNKRFNSDDTELLSRFAELASVALDNALLLENMRQLAYYDSLTGLPNRLFFQEQLAKELEQARQGKASGAVLYADIDDLKLINDTLGHSYGDRVIAKIGKDIAAAIDPDALTARVAGDEFFVILSGVNDRDVIGGIADKLVRLLCQDYEEAGENTVQLSISIGIVRYPAEGDTAEEILKNVDLALHKAKASGKNTWCFYKPELQADALEHMRLKRGLQKAVERRELLNAYQPIINSQTGCVAGFEALVRWHSAEYGMVMPGRFIPIAEQDGIIRSIGQWVLEEACQFARMLADGGNGHIAISVNVSPRQLLAGNFVAIVSNAINAAGISPSQLEIEITENALIESLKEGAGKLAELRRIGVRLALDDFGTGYSSLTYLKNLPVGVLKLDKSFVDTIAVDEAQLQFICSIIDMAHALKLVVVAEGVETEEQLRCLQNCRCDFIQGYYISRPVDSEAAKRFLAGNAGVVGSG